MLAVLAVLCTAWQGHLGRAPLPWRWSVPLAALSAPLLLKIILRIPARPASLRASVLLSGLLLYGMIWALKEQHANRHLQALASIALLLPLALFARPQVQFAAICLGLTAMLYCGKTYGGYLQSALLVFTPAGLCVIVSLVLRRLSIASVRFPELRLDYHSLTSWHYAPGNELRLLLIAPILALALATLLSRKREARAAFPDFVYLVLLAGLLAGFLFRPSIEPSTISEIEMIGSAGAMSLIAAGPPRRSRLRLLLLLVFALAFALQPHSLLR